MVHGQRSFKTTKQTNNIYIYTMSDIVIYICIYIYNYIIYIKKKYIHNNNILYIMYFIYIYIYYAIHYILHIKYKIILYSM